MTTVLLPNVSSAKSAMLPKQNLDSKSCWLGCRLTDFNRLLTCWNLSVTVFYFVDIQLKLWTRPHWLQILRHQVAELLSSQKAAAGRFCQCLKS